VAQFPWDPKPDPVPAPAPQANPAPANTAQSAQQAAASYTQSTLSPQAVPQPISHPANAQANGNGVAIKNEPGNDPVIKQEPGLNNPNANLAYANPNTPRGGMAAQRAAQALESQYGMRAAKSINAIQSGLASQMNPAQQQPQQPQRPGQPQQGQPQQQMSQQQYRQGLANPMQQRMPQPQQPPHPGVPNGLPAAQVDGPSDGFEGVMMRRGPDGRPVEMGRVEIDNLLHAQMAARAKEMEGGGLMLPLREATRHGSVAKKRPTPAGPSQLDGPDDEFKDEELDDDAINSDLDDPDDEKDDDDDDEEMSHMMLCMYDKVQRVKNKWLVVCAQVCVISCH
jgi:transcription initiation factor TFIIA large subunit